MSSTPWRITFDTNPDDCNFKCLMCEEHSPFSPKQAARIASGQPQRRMDIRVLEQGPRRVERQPTRRVSSPPQWASRCSTSISMPSWSFCRHYGIRLNLTTNRTSPKGGALEWAGKIVPLGSDVKISFNGIQSKTQEKHHAEQSV